MTLTGWRIVLDDQAGTAFDGEGARVFGGRWNSVGVPMVYASEHQSLAALEVRVHIDRTRMRRRYKSFAFEFDAKWMKALPNADLPRDWVQEPPPPSLQKIGDGWVKSGASVILASGTTVQSVADELLARSNLTVFTNCLQSCMKLCARNGNRVFMLGGEVQTKNRATLGRDATEGPQLDGARVGEVRRAGEQVLVVELRRARRQARDLELEQDRKSVV